MANRPTRRELLSAPLGSWFTDDGGGLWYRVRHPQFASLGWCAGRYVNPTTMELNDLDDGLFWSTEEQINRLVTYRDPRDLLFPPVTEGDLAYVRKSLGLKEAS